MQPGETEGSTLGTGAGIWAGLSLLLALLLGGYVSTRTGAHRTTGFFEGALVERSTAVLCAMGGRAPNAVRRHPS